MNIRKDSFIGKLFFLGLEACEAFTGEYFASKYEKGTNLCHFVRTVFLYLPAIIILQMGIWIYAVTALIIIPIEQFGLKEFFVTLAIIVGIIIIAVIALSLLLFYREIFEYFLGRKIRNRKSNKSSILSILREWIKAKKQKICPLISFEEA